MATARENHLGRTVALEAGDEGMSVVVAEGRAHPSDGMAPGGTAQSFSESREDGK